MRFWIDISKGLVEALPSKNNRKKCLPHCWCPARGYVHVAVGFITGLGFFQSSGRVGPSPWRHPQILSLTSTSYSCGMLNALQDLALPCLSVVQPFVPSLLAVFFHSSGSDYSIHTISKMCTNHQKPQV